jgi:hypothetical protein
MCMSPDASDARELKNSSKRIRNLNAQRRLKGAMHAVRLSVGLMNTVRKTPASSTNGTPAAGGDKKVIPGLTSSLNTFPLKVSTIMEEDVRGAATTDAQTVENRDPATNSTMSNSEIEL